MTQVITIDYHYSDDENQTYGDRPFKFGQRELPNGEFALWDITNNKEVPWNKSEGICASIDKYILDNIDIKGAKCH